MAAAGLALAQATPASAAEPGMLIQKLASAGSVTGTALRGAQSVAVSPDGITAYATSHGSNSVPGIVVFDRDPGTGALTQKAGTDGCITADGTSSFPDNTPGACAQADLLGAPSSVTFSADGANVYFGSGSGVLVFDRDPGTGVLTQKAGTDGCITDDGSSGQPDYTPGTCADGVATVTITSVAVSPDGNHLYAASNGGPVGAVVIFDRDPDTGVLTQKAGTAGCISENGGSSDGSGTCVDGTAVDRATSVTVSPDGASVYVASDDTYITGGVAVFDRDLVTGGLTQKAGTAGCISGDGSSGAPDYTADACVDGRGLDGAAALAVTPDGSNLYVASERSGAVSVFDRDPDGALTQKAGPEGCISENGSNGDCIDGTALHYVHALTVSPDGTNVYAGGRGLTLFNRDPDTGVLAQRSGIAGCITEDGTSRYPDNTPGVCVRATSVPYVYSVAASPDGDNVYAVTGEAIAVFDRAGGSAVPPSTGELIQKAAPNGCISNTGTGGDCVDGTALDAAISVAVSPDNANVYAASQSSSAVTIFDRDADGALAQKAGTAGCISPTGTSGPPDFTANACAIGRGLSGANSVTVSPDGANVYATAASSDAVVIFDRDPLTGALTQKAGTDGCISDTGTGGACVDGTALDRPLSITVSPDGGNVYVALSGDHAVAVLDRDPLTGALTQKAGTDGCISENGHFGACADGTALLGASAVVVSPDGESVYATADTSDAVAIFDRDSDTGALTQKAGTDGCISENGTGGACVDGTALDSPRSLAVSPDGSSLYTASAQSGAVAVFDRGPTGGALTQKAETAGCASQDGTGGACVDGTALDGADGVTVSPDGANVYVAAVSSRAVSVFDRDRTTGAIAQKAGYRFPDGAEVPVRSTCISEDGNGGTYADYEACVDGVALQFVTQLTVSPDAMNLYGASNQSDAIVVFDRTLIDGTEPTIDVTTPAAGAQVVRTELVLADYTCADEAGGSGLDTCVGTVAAGDPVDTSTLGDHDVTVTATDLAGNQTVLTQPYTVVPIPGHPFTDVPLWVDDAVSWIAHHQYATGYPGDLFQPDRPITRAQVARMLYRIAHSPDVTGPDHDHPFTDVPPWADDAVRWITHDPDGPGPQPPIATGYPGDLFQPDRPITRAQVTRMLYRIDADLVG